MVDAGPQHLLRRGFAIDTLVEVRHQVQQQASDTGLADLALYRFVVAVNEITTNAVRHGGGTGHLELWRTGGRLHCRVTDHGPGLPTTNRPRHPTPHATGGRGLWLAWQGIDDLVIDTGPHGTTITLTTLTV